MEISLLLLFISTILLNTALSSSDIASYKLQPSRSIFIINKNTAAPNEDIILEVDMASTYAHSEYDTFQLCRRSKNIFGNHCIDFNVRPSRRVSQPTHALSLNQLKEGSYTLVFTKRKPRRKTVSLPIKIWNTVESDEYPVKVTELKDTKMDLSSFNGGMRSHLESISKDYIDYLIEIDLNAKIDAYVELLSCSGSHRFKRKYKIEGGKAKLWNLRKDGCFVIQVFAYTSFKRRWLGFPPKLIHRQYLNLPFRYVELSPSQISGKKNLIFVIESKKKPKREYIDYMRDLKRLEFSDSPFVKQREREKWESDILKQKERVAELEKKLQAVHSKWMNDIEKGEVLESQLNEAQSSLLRKQQELENERGLKEQLEKEKESLENSKSSLEIQLEKTEFEKRVSIENLQSELESAEIRISTEEENIARLNEELDKKSQFLKDVTTERDNMEEKYKQSGEREDQYAVKLLMKRLEMAILKQEKLQIEEEKELVEGVKKQKETELDEKTSMLQSKLDEIVKLKEKIEYMISERNQLTDNLRLKKTELQNKEKELNEKEFEFMGKLNLKKTELDEKTSMLQSKSDEIVKLEEKIEDMINEQEQLNDNLLLKNTELQNKESELHQKAVEFMEKLKVKETEIAKKTSELENLETTKAQLQIQVNELKSKVKVSSNLGTKIEPADSEIHMEHARHGSISSRGSYSYEKPNVDHVNSEISPQAYFERPEFGQEKKYEVINDFHKNLKNFISGSKNVENHINDYTLSTNNYYNFVDSIKSKAKDEQKVFILGHRKMFVSSFPKTVYRPEDIFYNTKVKIFPSGTQYRKTNYRDSYECYEDVDLGNLCFEPSEGKEYELLQILDETQVKIVNEGYYWNRQNRTFFITSENNLEILKKLIPYTIKEVPLTGWGQWGMRKFYFSMN